MGAFVSRLEGVHALDGMRYSARWSDYDIDDPDEDDEDEFLSSAMDKLNCYARCGDKSINILNALHFSTSRGAIISAFFVIALLPVINVLDFGCVRVISDCDTLSELLTVGQFDLTNSTLTKSLIAQLPLGLRVTKAENETRCACLFVSDNDSIVDFIFAIDNNGYVAKRTPRVLTSLAIVLY